MPPESDPVAGLRERVIVTIEYMTATSRVDWHDRHFTELAALLAEPVPPRAAPCDDEQLKVAFMKGVQSAHESRAEPVRPQITAARIHEATDNAGLPCDGDHSKGWGTCQQIAERLPETSAEPVPPALAPLFHEALASTIDHLRARAYVVNHHLVVNFEDVYDALAARLTDPMSDVTPKTESGLRPAEQALIDAMGFRGDGETIRAIAMVLAIREEAASKAVAEPYRERNALVAALIRSHGWPAQVVMAPDTEGWWIVYAETPAGQVSWHIAPDDMDLFSDWPVAFGSHQSPWDGHTTDEKYRRLRALIASERKP